MDWRYMLAKWAAGKLYSWWGRKKIKKFANGTDNTIDDKLVHLLDAYFKPKKG